jgi:uncharacterized membrane protein YjgN (DUF898 family)
MLGCPLLIMTVSVVVFSLFMSSTISMGSYTAIIVGIGIGTLALLLGSAIMQGVYTAQWYGMLVNNLQYGTQKFAATYSIKKYLDCALLYVAAVSVPGTVAVYHRAGLLYADAIFPGGGR